MGASVCLTWRERRQPNLSVGLASIRVPRTIMNKFCKFMGHVKHYEIDTSARKRHLVCVSIHFAQELTFSWAIAYVYRYWPTCPISNTILRSDHG